MPDRSSARRHRGGNLLARRETRVCARSGEGRTTALWGGAAPLSESAVIQWEFAHAIGRNTHSTFADALAGQAAPTAVPRVRGGVDTILATDLGRVETVALPADALGAGRARGVARATVVLVFGEIDATVGAGDHRGDLAGALAFCTDLAFRTGATAGAAVGGIGRGVRADVAALERAFGTGAHAVGADLVEVAGDSALPAVGRVGHRVRASVAADPGRLGTDAGPVDARLVAVTAEVARATMGGIAGRVDTGVFASQPIEAGARTVDAGQPGVAPADVDDDEAIAGIGAALHLVASAEGRRRVAGSEPNARAVGADAGLGGATCAGGAIPRSPTGAGFVADLGEQAPAEAAARSGFAGQIGTEAADAAPAGSTNVVVDAGNRVRGEVGAGGGVGRIRRCVGGVGRASVGVSFGAVIVGIDIGRVGICRRGVAGVGVGFDIAAAVRRGVGLTVHHGVRVDDRDDHGVRRHARGQGERREDEDGQTHPGESEHRRIGSKDDLRTTSVELPGFRWQIKEQPVPLRPGRPYRLAWQ